MQDLKARINAHLELDRSALIAALIRMDSQAQAQAKGSGQRAKQGTTERNRAEQARDDSERLGRIIYFLRFRALATNTPEADSMLCTTLAQELEAKGQWTGDHST